MARNELRDGIWRGRVAHGQAVGEGSGGPCREPRKASLFVLALIGSQMVAVNSSSPTAACSGPWDARGMEESLTTSDGNAESLYMQGVCRRCLGFQGRVGGRNSSFLGAWPVSGHFAPHYPAQNPNWRFPAISEQGTVSRNKPGLKKGLEPEQPRPHAPTQSLPFKALLPP